MGGGIAFPHGRINLIKTPLVAVGLSPKKGIPFPSKSGSRKISTYLIFMLLLPSSDYPVNIAGKSKQYINAISSVAKFLRTIKSKKLVKSFKSEPDFLNFVEKYLEENG
ncbi:MAG: hypothetical protein APR63_01185 [Desulfuromonas sp. SDB]|nr:MAG: hypothetical protein APR63_01185 [Desulfuromonas sp. SDB]